MMTEITIITHPQLINNEYIKKEFGHEFVQTPFSIFNDVLEIVDFFIYID